MTDSGKISAAICEDEAVWARSLRRRTGDWLAARGLEGRTELFRDGESLLASPCAFDIVLMDLKLPGIHGLEAIRRLRAIRADSQVVIVTAFPEYALEAFRLDTVHYLIKPVAGSAFFQAMDRAAARLVRGRGPALTVRRGTETLRLPLADILWCEVVDHRVYVRTAAGSWDWVGALDRLEKELDGRFFRCHKSFLVNMDQVAGRRGDAALLLGGGQVPISRRKQGEFSRRLLDRARNGWEE